MTVIDLGEMRGRSTDEPPPARPRRYRELGLAAVVAVSLLLIGTAAPAPVPFRMLGRIYAIPGDLLLMDGDRVFVAKTREATRTLDAYDVRDGSRLWSTPYPVGVSPDSEGVGGMWLSDGLLTVEADGVPGIGAAAVALDTGRVVWRARLIFGDVAGGRDVLVGDGTSVSLLDGGTGTTIWTRPVPGCVVNPFPEDPDHFALRCDHGADLRLVDVATGTVRATRDLSTMITGVDETGSLAYNLIVSDGTLAVAYDGAVIGLRLGDLGVRWGPVRVAPDTFPYPCAHHVCVVTAGDMSLLDPATGRIVGHEPLDVRVPESPQADAFGGARVARPPAAVLTPFDPDAPLESGRDTVLSMADHVTEMPIYAGGYPTWVVRAVRDPRAPQGYRFRAIGQLNGILASACFGAKRYFACATATGQLTFYAVAS